MGRDELGWIDVRVRRSTSSRTVGHAATEWVEGLSPRAKRAAAPVLILCPRRTALQHSTDSRGLKEPVEPVYQRPPRGVLRGGFNRGAWPPSGE